MAVRLRAAYRHANRHEESASERPPEPAQTAREEPALGSANYNARGGRFSRTFGRAELPTTSVKEPRGRNVAARTAARSTAATSRCQLLRPAEIVLARLETAPAPNVPRPPAATEDGGRAQAAGRRAAVPSVARWRCGPRLERNDRVARRPRRKARRVLTEPLSEGTTRRFRRPSGSERRREPKRRHEPKRETAPHGPCRPSGSPAGSG
jgi:hypothetical protein